MHDEIIIELVIEPKENQLIPNDDEIDELIKILSDCVDEYLNQLAEDLIKDADA